MRGGVPGIVVFGREGIRRCSLRGGNRDSRHKAENDGARALSFLLFVVRRRELIFARVIRVPITGGAVDDKSECRSDVGHEQGKRAQHRRQQRLAG
jgi:hypothetical protein